jgi:hypothetical protein
VYLVSGGKLLVKLIAGLLLKLFLRLVPKLLPNLILKWYELLAGIRP